MDIIKQQMVKDRKFKQPKIKNISILIIRELKINIFYKEELKEEDLKMKFLLNHENVLKIVNHDVELKKPKEFKLILMLLNTIKFLEDLEEFKQGDKNEC